MDDTKLDNYEQCSCGSDCGFMNMFENEPCWGYVQAVDEITYADDYGWVHMCEGHADKHWGENYKEFVNE